MGYLGILRLSVGRNFYEAWGIAFVNLLKVNGLRFSWNSRPFLAYPPYL